MEVRKLVEEEILQAISEIGSFGATITEIEKLVSYERHTLSKYLSFMQGHRLIYHKKVGKAKIWFINDAPIQTVLHSPSEMKTFTEQILINLITNMPLGLVVIDSYYNILFFNKQMEEIYGKKEGELFYKVCLGLKNPLQLLAITDLIEHKSKSAEVVIKDMFGDTLNIKGSRLVNPNKSESIILIIEDLTKLNKRDKAIRNKGKKIKKNK